MEPGDHRPFLCLGQLRRGLRHPPLRHIPGWPRRTPQVAITVFTIAVFVIPTVMQHFTNPLTTFGDAGTLAAFGFLLAYFLISIAAPAYLRRRGELTRKNIVVFVLAMLCLLVPTVGSFYPLPVAPIRYFPYYFFAYMLVGACWLAIVSR